MKKKIRRCFVNVADYLELTIALIIIVLIAVSFVMLAKEVLSYFSDNDNELFFNTALGATMNIVIGIEFLKMLTKHTLKSIVEVIIFAISRTLIVDQASSLEFLFGVVAICALLIARKYLFIPSIDDIA